MGTITDKLAYTLAAVNDIYMAVIEKGGNIAQSTDIANVGSAIRNISTGNDIVIFSPTTIDVTMLAGSLPIMVASNVDITLECNAPDVDIDGEGQTASINAGIKEVIVGYGENSDVHSRQLNIIAKKDNVTLGVCSINQAAGFQQYKCLICGYIYDEELGEPDNGYPAGTTFAQLPSNYTCPLCGATKEQFILLT